MREVNVKEAMTLALLVTCGTLAAGLVRFVSLNLRKGLLQCCLKSSLQLYVYIWRPRWYLRHIPRPEGGELLRGHSRVLRKQAPGRQLSQWFRELGPLIQYDGNLSVRP